MPHAICMADRTLVPTDEGWLCLARVEVRAQGKMVGRAVVRHRPAGSCPTRIGAVSPPPTPDKLGEGLAP